MQDFLSSAVAYTKKISLLKQIVKFSIVGGAAAVLNFSIYFSLTNFGQVWYIYSAIGAYVLSAVFNFIANKIWTFRNSQMGHHAIQQAARFTVVVITGLIGNTGIIYFLTDMRHVDYRLSWVVATVVIAVWNFSFNRLWTFRLSGARLS